MSGHPSKGPDAGARTSGEGSAGLWPEDATANGGVALANFVPNGTRLSLHDRRTGTVGLAGSLAVGRKLERIMDNPRLAVAYHTREHRPRHYFRAPRIRTALLLVNGLVTRLGYRKARRRRARSEHSTNPMGHTGPP
jgi:hypothetical protein